MSHYVKALTAAREAKERADNATSDSYADACKECAWRLRDLLAAIDAQPKAGEVWQYRANSTYRGKAWIDCRDEEDARRNESGGFEIRCLYAATPAPEVPFGWRVVWFTGSFKRGCERWEVYDPEGSGGAVDERDVQDNYVRDLLDAFAKQAQQPTPPAPAVP